MIDEIRNITLVIVSFRNVNKHYTYFSFDACPFLLYAVFDVFMFVAHIFYSLLY